MTPTQIITAARRKYNSVGDTFYADAEILDLLYQCEMELALDAFTIEATATASSAAGTQSYAYPTRCVALKRVTYNGQKLKKISFSEDDALTFLNENDTTQGTPLYYYEFNSYVYLRPIPDSIKTIKYFYYKEPTILTSSDTLETPTKFHMVLVDGIVAEMMYKDENASMGDRYRAKFEKGILEAKKWQKQRLRQDSFNYVKDNEMLVKSVLGEI